MQIYSRKIDIAKIIPIKYINMNDSIVFENELPSHVELSLRDYGASIIKYFRQPNDTLFLDFGKIYANNKNTFTLTGNDYEAILRSKLLPSSELISFTPSSITLNYQKANVKKVPIIFDGLIEIAVGHQLEEDIIVTPDSILLIGAKQYLDSIQLVYTVQDTIVDIKSNQQIPVNIVPIKGIKTIPQYITVDVTVDEFINKSIDAQIECINLPEDLNIKFFPSEIKISFFVGIKRSKSIDKKNFKVLVNYNDIQNTPNANTVAIQLVEYPDFVRIQLFEPNEVEFILEHKEKIH